MFFNELKRANIQMVVSFFLSVRQYCFYLLKFTMSSTEKIKMSQNKFFCFP